MIPLRSISLKDKKHFTSGNFFYTVCINSGYIYSYLFSSTDRREDAGLFLGVVEAPIQWVSELTDELMAKIRAHEYGRSMDLPS